MKFKPRLWEPIAWVVSGINLVSVWFAALPGETWHATSHAALAAAFAIWAQHLRRKGKQGTTEGPLEERLNELEARLADVDRLQDIPARLAELEERWDFAERALIDVRARAQVPPKE